MAHDHRMNPIGEPHLNARKRMSAEKRYPEGRSSLPRLKDHLAAQLEADWNTQTNLSPFMPDFLGAVESRVDNYRADRTWAQRKGVEMSDLDRETAQEIGSRFKNRRSYS